MNSGLCAAALLSVRDTIEENGSLHQISSTLNIHFQTIPASI